MPAFILNIGSSTTGVTLPDGVSGMLIFAQDTAAAELAAQAAYGGDGNNLWVDTTPTTIAAGANFEGWRLKISILGAAGQSNLVDIITVTGAASATLDSIGTLAATALNGTPDIAASAYATGTNILTIAAIGDALGDGTVFAEFLPPLDSAMFQDPSFNFSNFVTSVVDGGAAGAALSLTLVDDAVPNIALRYKQV